MIVANKEADSVNFENLLKKTTDNIENDAKKDPDYFIKQDGVKLEKVVYDFMVASAKSTIFENTIQLISGGNFPDIVANTNWGVEVKSTQSDHWKTTGNSVLESTRIKSVERTYIIFGKLVKPPKFRFRRYEDCLYDIAVTHSPRYLVDMDTDKTIFQKIGINYDDLRNSTNPLTTVTKYYRKTLKPGEEIWWLSSGEEKEEIPIQSIKIRLWNELSAAEKENLEIEAMARFPEIFSSGAKKYARLAKWLAAAHGIVSPSLRDTFTAGGQQEIKVKDIKIKNVPQIFKHLQDKMPKISDSINALSDEEIKQYWIETPPCSKRLDSWIGQVIKLSKNNLYNNDLNLKTMITESLANSKKK